MSTSLQLLQFQAYELRNGKINSHEGRKECLMEIKRAILNCSIERQRIWRQVDISPVFNDFVEAQNDEVFVCLWLFLCSVFPCFLCDNFRLCWQQDEKFHSELVTILGITLQRLKNVESILNDVVTKANSTNLPLILAPRRAASSSEASGPSSS